MLTTEEVTAIIAAASARDGAQGLRLACLIEILYAAGLRVSELTSLSLSAVARDPAYLIVKGKGGKERLAPLNASAREAIKAYLEVRLASCRRETRRTRGCFPRAGRPGG